MFKFNEVQNILEEINAERDTDARPQTPELKFKPEYLTGSSERDKAINAIIEIRAVWDYTIRAAHHNYSKVYSQLTIPITEDMERKCQKLKFGVYDKVTKQWLIKTSQEPEYEEPEYNYCYADRGFVDFNNAESETGLLLVGKYTILKQEPNLLEETKTAPELFDELKLPTFKLIVGVPGCGKTAFIIQNHQPGSLVLTSCSQAAHDVRARMAAAHNKLPTIYRRSYRTVDSYLLNSREKYGIVWADEALMQHPGKLFLVCLFSGCRTMYLLGDLNQLSYINRIEEINLLYDDPKIFFTPIASLNTSHRCPVDVAAILSSKYDGGAYSTSDVMFSMQCKEFTDLECVPKSDNIKYLVFKQVEKQQMKKAKYKNVSTIHEFQGKEADDVVIVRMTRDENEELYHSVAHILVGVSRHKKSLVYYTPFDDDMKKLIETPRTLTDLEKFKKKIE